MQFRSFNEATCCRMLLYSGKHSPPTYRIPSFPITTIFNLAIQYRFLPNLLASIFIWIVLVTDILDILYKPSGLKCGHLCEFPLPNVLYEHSFSMQVNEVILEVVEGDPRNVLCEAAEKHHASMLVVGNHGYGAIKRYVNRRSSLFPPVKFRYCRVSAQFIDLMRSFHGCNFLFSSH